MIRWFARTTRGADYNIDEALEVRDLVVISCRRLVQVLRGCVRMLCPPLPPRRWVFIGRSVELRHRNHLTIGPGAVIGSFVLLDALSKDGVHIGPKTTIGDYTQILATGVMSDLGLGCAIGADSAIGAFSFIGAAGGVRIGSSVIIGQRASFHSENHRFDRLDVRIRDQGVTRAGIVVGDDCWVGANVTFLDGTSLGEGCVVGAGSVLRGDIPDRSVVVGNPCRVVRTRGAL